MSDHTLVIEAIQSGATTIEEIAEDTFASEALQQAAVAVQTARERLRPILGELLAAGTIIEKKRGSKSLYFKS